MGKYEQVLSRKFCKNVLIAINCVTPYNLCNDTILHKALFVYCSFFLVETNCIINLESFNNFFKR